jgi:hypothetical protein
MLSGSKGVFFIVSETPFKRGQTMRVLTNWTARLSVDRY